MMWPGRGRKSHGHKKSAKDKGPEKDNMGRQKCPCRKKGTDIDKKRDRYKKKPEKGRSSDHGKKSGTNMGPGKDRTQDRVVVTFKNPEKDRVLDCGKKTAMGPGRDWKPDGENRRQQSSQKKGTRQGT